MKGFQKLCWLLAAKGLREKDWRWLFMPLFCRNCAVLCRAKCAGWAAQAHPMRAALGLACASNSVARGLTARAG